MRAVAEPTLDQVARLLPPLRRVPRGDSARLPGKRAARFACSDAGAGDALRRQRWRHVQHVQHLPKPQQHAQHTLGSLLPHVPPGTLRGFDRGYCRFPWVDTRTAQGRCWVSRLRQQTSATVAHVF